ncbi:MAG: right-handed parallel beta-helix repeat-containing protein [Candidatus Aenigmarchaeota archaeon]|nr:right-handed parallel beta-helix repeat-containing protein [Candidatus Aenigmarchaeota archaeon]
MHMGVLIAVGLVAVVLASGCTSGERRTLPPEPPPGQPPGGGPPSSPGEIPQDFQDMLSFQAERTFYIATNEPGASNENDGLSPTAQGGSGPWKDFSALRERDLVAGDAVAVREGTYFVTTEEGKKGISIKSGGTAAKPVRVYASPGEAVVLEGGYTSNQADTVRQDPKAYSSMIHPRGSYLILEGFTVKGCYVICFTLFGVDHLILKDNTVQGGLEDGIKTTTTASNILIMGNDFSGFFNEAIDVFGAQRAYIMNNEFHDPDRGRGDPSAVLWTKGGARDIRIWYNNFRDVVGNNHILILGGCCWNSWDGQAGVDPVAQDVEARGNVLTNVELAGTYAYRGALGVEGCRNCTFLDNVVDGAESGIGIHPTQDRDTGISLPPKDIQISGNRLVGISSGRMVNIKSDSAEGLVMRDNTYYTDSSPTFRLGNDVLNQQQFQAREYDAGSAILPAGDFQG